MPHISKPLLITLKLAVTAAVIAFIVRKLGWDNIVASVRQADMHWLLGGLILFWLSCLLGAFQWQLLLRNRNITMRFGQAFQLYFIGMFFNNFILGTAAGDAVRVAYIKLDGGKGKAALAATFLDRVAGLWTILGFAVAGSIILLHRGLVHGLPLTTAVISLFVTFVGFNGLVCFLVSKRLQAVFYGLLDRFRVPRKDSVRAVVDQMLIEAHDFRLMGRVAVLSALVQLMRIGVHVMCGASLGLVSYANFQYYLIFVPMLAILMTIPLPFGIREVVGGALFAMAGFAVHKSLIMGFLASVVGIVASSLGAIFFITKRVGAAAPAPVIDPRKPADTPVQ